MQLKIKRMLAISLIVLFLASTPLVLAKTHEDNSGLIKVVYDLKIDVNDAKPSGTPGGGSHGGDSTGGLYTLIAKGLYQYPADLYYKPNNEDPYFYTAILNSVNEYNSHKTLFSGTIIQYDSIEADSKTVDYKNELLFGDLGDTGIIAQTTSWITRGSKLIVDFDIVFNTYYDWGNPGATSDKAYAVDYMDTQSIITHEMGHGVGLGDLYKTQAYWQTMYGFADFGQTWKRTLESGDIAGLTALYG